MDRPLTHESRIREAVRQRYAAAAEGVSAGDDAGCCGSDAGCGCDGSAASAERQQTFGAGIYPDADRDALPDEARLASLGCGNPTAVADLRPGETVLDLGSGGGIDVLLSARRVGPTGYAYGLDMTVEMLELARRNQARAGLENAEFLEGTIERVPLADDSVDVIVSNCVLNLSADKPRAFAEAARVLRPGGRLAITDVVADPDMDEATRRDMEEWTGCIAGALTVEDFRHELAATGFDEVQIEVTHRVHDHAASAVVRARRPG